MDCLLVAPKHYCNTYRPIFSTLLFLGGYMLFPGSVLGSLCASSPVLLKEPFEVGPLRLTAILHLTCSFPKT